MYTLQFPSILYMVDNIVSTVKSRVETSKFGLQKFLSMEYFVVIIDIEKVICFAFLKV